MWGDEQGVLIYSCGMYIEKKSTRIFSTMFSDGAVQKVREDCALYLPVPVPVLSICCVQAKKLFRRSFIRSVGQDANKRKLLTANIGQGQLAVFHDGNTVIVSSIARNNA